MNKILLIIKREYFSRVKKKSFLIMTFLVPMLIIGMYALIFALSMKGGDNIPAVEVIDDSGIFNKGLENKKSATFSKSDSHWQRLNRKLLKMKMPLCSTFQRILPAAGLLKCSPRKRQDFQ
jgi:ABC-2 type transport system permease protein